VGSAKPYGMLLMIHRLDFFVLFDQQEITIIKGVPLQNIPFSLVMQ
jgi:hypothetical protein